MKMTSQAVRFLSGILGTCMFEKGDMFSREQKEYLDDISPETNVEDFSKIFPLEGETSDKLVSLAFSMGKNVVDAQVILTFFGGDLHIDHAREDVAENGLTGTLADIFLFFHVVIPVRISKNGSSIDGIYKNGDLAVKLGDLNVMETLGKNFEGENISAFVHYGTVFDAVERNSQEEKMLLDSQAASDFFIKTCSRLKTLDCGKMLQALQFAKGGCHRNIAR